MQANKQSFTQSRESPSYLGVLVKLVCSDVINGKDELNTLGLGLFDEGYNLFSASSVVDGFSNLMIELAQGQHHPRKTHRNVIQNLLEGERHATANYKGVNLAGAKLIVISVKKKHLLPCPTCSQLVESYRKP